MQDVYITRKVTLANASTALKVLFDAVRYNSTSIDIYFATLEQTILHNLMISHGLR